MIKIQNWLTLHGSVVLILSISLTVQAIAFSTVLVSTRTNNLQLETLIGDSGSYKRIAENLLCCSVFSFSVQPPFLPDSHRTPGYPAFLAVLYSVTRSWVVVLFFQALLLSAAPLFLYIICRRFNERVAFIAALIFAFEPTRLFWSNLLMTDAVFSLSMLAAVYLFFRWFDEHRERYLFASGIILGISTLIRPIGLYLWIAFCAAIFVRYGIHFWKKAFVASMLFLMGFFIFVAPWMIRNRVNFGSFQLSPLGSYSFAYANAVQFAHYKTGKSISDLLAEFNRPLLAQPMEDSVSLRNMSWYKTFSKRMIGTDYFGYTKFHIIKTIPFFFTDGLREIPELLGFINGEQRPNLSNYFMQKDFVHGLSSYFRAQPLPFILFVIGSGFWFLIWLGAVLAIPSILRDRKRFAEWILLFLIIGYIVAASSGPVAQARYRLPMTGFLLFTAIFGWKSFISWFRFFVIKSQAETLNLLEKQTDS